MIHVLFKLETGEERWLSGIKYKYFRTKGEEDKSSYPSGSLGGGLFEIEFNSTDHDDFFLIWAKGWTIYAGEFIFYDAEQIVPLFRIEFWDCACVSLEETMTSMNAESMKTKLSLSPAITRNRHILHEKAWKVTELDNASPMVANTTENAIITDAYWIDGDGNRQKDFPVDTSITLYVVLDNYQSGINVSLEFNTISEGKSYNGKFSGITDQEGLLIIENFKLQQTNNT